MGIPLTVFGGFLGAGKTTVLNRLLASGRCRYGVLELADGCVCCSPGNELGDGLAVLAARVPAPEHVLVEASGVSDPWRVAELVLVEGGFDLQPLVVVADAAALPRQLADRRVRDTVARQLAYAEIVALTRTDLVDAGPAEAAIRARRAEARIVHAPHGVLPAGALRFDAAPRRRRASRFAAEDTTHPFVAWSWRDPPPLDPDRLRAVLAELPPSVLRVKGVCGLGGEAAPHLLQYAAERWVFSPFEGVARFALVAIGTADMPAADVLDALFATAAR
jgi:G3E family GTPase